MTGRPVVAATSGPASAAVAAGSARRADVLADTGVGGRALTRRLSAVTDEMLAGLFAEAAAGRRARGAVALLAVGGYGRGELAPQSDLDVLLVHEGRAKGVDELASALWYPLWDAGLKLGHAVRSVDDELSLAADDLDTATSLLTARTLAGDDELAARVALEGRARWRRRSRKWLEVLRAGVDQRHERAGDVAFLLEPDLKEGRGGLRDVQALWWAEAADLVLRPADRARLDACYDTLVDVRVALHRLKGRPGDVLRLEDQDAVAAALGLASSDALMAGVAAAGRTVSWLTGSVWNELGRHVVDAGQRVADGVDLVGGEIDLAARADPHADPTLLLRAAVAAARHRAPLSRSALDRLADVEPWDEWPAGARDELVALLREGPAAIDVLEALDQHELVTRMLPEWEVVRSRPQRNAYHRFTVDRHLWEAAANAAALAGRVDRPDLLVLGALFHDIGKGRPGDHTDVGVELVGRIGPRLGLDGEDTGVLVAMVRHHLLLPDVAVRRDLDDPATVEHVATAVGSVGTLQLLHALTEADSLATGPSAWGSWKAQLVADLVDRVRQRLLGGPAGGHSTRAFPDADADADMAAGEVVIRTAPCDDTEPGTQRITIVCPDALGTFARIAGVLSLHGLDVVSAVAHTGDAEPGRVPMAACRFRVTPTNADRGWDPVLPDVRRALDGELAIEARLADRARTYRRRRATRAGPPIVSSVAFHDDASGDSTVIEVRAASAIGVLHRIAKALAELGLDIRHATAQTLGEDVVDTFYVRTRSGGRVTDPFHRAEIERAVLYAVA